MKRSTTTVEDDASRVVDASSVAFDVQKHTSASTTYNAFRGSILSLERLLSTLHPLRRRRGCKTRYWAPRYGPDRTFTGKSTSALHDALLSRYGVARAWSEWLDGYEDGQERHKAAAVPLKVMLVCVRWYVAYPLSLRNLEEMMQERGVRVDHFTIHRWILKLMPVLERTFRKRKAAVSTSWRMDETYIKVGGQWKYLYRAVDKTGSVSR